MFCVRPSLVFALLASGLFAPAIDAMTPAGAVIENTAQVEYRIGGFTEHAESNRHLLRVDEIIRFDVTAAERTAPGMHPLEETVYTLDVRNAGNGSQCFSLAAAPAAAGQASLEPVTFAIDTNGDGKFDPAIDAVLPAGQCGPVLAPGESVQVLVIARMPETVGADGAAQLSITVGTPKAKEAAGALLRGFAQGGGDAVLAGTPADATVTFTATASSLAVSLEKSQSVSDDSHRTSAAPGEIITYSLTIRASGEGIVSDAIVNDPLPADLAYVPGSLRLDDEILSDLDDDDAGDVIADAVRVRLPRRAAPFVSRVTFKALVRQPLS